MIVARKKIVLVITLGSLAAWIVIGGIVLPETIAKMYVGDSLSFLNGLISGQDFRPLAFYIAKVRYIFGAGFVVQLVIGTLLYLAPQGLPVWKTIKTTWNRYWFRSTATLFLGMTRIVCVGTALILVYARWDYTRGLAHLPEGLYEPLLVNRTLLLLFFGGAQPSETAITVILWLTCVAGALAFLGFRANLSVFLFAVGNMFLAGYRYSFRDFHHPDAVMAIALVLIALGPSGRSLSIDAIFASRRDGSRDLLGMGQRSLFGAWPLLLIQGLLAIIYLDSGIQKLYFGGLEWIKGPTLGYYLMADSVNRGSQLAGLLIDQRWMLSLLSILTIIFETTFWLVIFKPRLALIYIPLGLGFHLGNLMLNIAGFYEFMALYVVFLPQLMGDLRTSPLTLWRRAGNNDLRDNFELAKTSVPSVGVRSVR